MASDRRRTARGIVALSLNVGVDPPDIIRRDPCARLECWMDPVSSDPEKSVQQVSEALVKQYEALQPRCKYIPAGDPHPETIEQECKRARRAAGSDRVLFHFNGHGVPACTASGEIWVFNEDYTQYLPVSMYEMMHWLVEPSVYVFDCNGAGHLVDWYRDALHESVRSSGQPLPSPATLVGMSVLFASCAKDEYLPTNPNLPADVFTSCLTTPIRMALLWHVQQKTLLTAFSDINAVIESIPGQLESRRTPLGELNWIFTSITDAIAYNSCDVDLFQRLFREDTLLASLCRNFLLAERVMRSSHKTPMSFPELPSVAQHPLWSTWDLEVERCIAAHALQRNIPPIVIWTPSTFFEDQLSSLDLWVTHGDASKASPAALPILLQALLSQAMREKALWSLARYMDLGPWAVGRALMLGVFPYLLKLLRSGSRNLRAPLLVVWGRVVAMEPGVVPELASRETLEYFLHTLASGSADDNQRLMACFILAQCCRQGGSLRDLVLAGDFLGQITVFASHPDPRLRSWCALAAGFAWKDIREVFADALANGCYNAIADMVRDPEPRVRASAAFALGCIGEAGSRLHLPRLAELLFDPSPNVRREAFVAVLGTFRDEPVEFRKVATASLQAELEDVALVVPNEADNVLYVIWSATRRAAVSDPDFQARAIARRATGLVSATLSSKLLALAEPSTGARIREPRSGGGMLKSNTSSSSLKESTTAPGAKKSAVESRSPRSKSPRSFGWGFKRTERVAPPKSSDPSPEADQSVSSTSPVSVSSDALPAVSPEVAKADAAGGETMSSTASSPQAAAPASMSKSSLSGAPTVRSSSAAPRGPSPSNASSAFGSIKQRNPETDEAIWPKFELAQIHTPLLVPSTDRTDPAFILRENLQQRHTHVVTEMFGHLSSLKKHLSQVPHDRERMRIKSNGEASVSALCFAAGPPEVLLVARGNLLREWRAISVSEDSVSVDDSVSPQAKAEEGGVLSPQRWWESEVAVSSVVAMNGHFLPLWVTGSVDGTVRIWGQPRSDDEIAPLVSSWTAGAETPLKLSWDGPGRKLYSTGGSVVDVWDALHEMRVGSFDLPGSGCSLHATLGTEVAVAGTSAGHVVLLDSRVEKPVHIWQEHSSALLCTTLSLDTTQNWNVLTAGSGDGNVLFWDLRAPSHSSRSLKVALGKNGQPARSMAVHPLLGHVSVATAEGVSVFSGTGKLLSSVRFFDNGAPTGGAEQVCFHPLSTSLACGLTMGDVLLLSP